MSDSSSIEWCDATWNPTRGCVKVSPGCAQCYAATLAERFRGVPDHPYEHGFDLRLVPENLTEPLRWKNRRRIFVNAMSDLFQDGVPDHFIDEVFAVMALAPRHAFQVLTKHADRMRAYISDDATFMRIVEVCNRAPESDAPAVARPSLTRLAHNVRREPHLMRWPLMNVWLGVSVENQFFADERIPLLLETPAAMRFVFCEPLLEAVDLGHYIGLDGANRNDFRERRGGEHETFSNGFTGRSIRADPRYPPERGVDWVIIGGEIGRGARPFHLSWARSLVAQCRAVRVAVFVKQLGRVPIMDESAWRTCGNSVHLLKARNQRSAPIATVALRFHSRNGADIAEWPVDLRVREFPELPG